MESVHAIVLAGGRSSRLGGIDKLLLRIDGLELLARVVAAVAHLDHVVVVGPRRELDLVRPVTWVREEPPFGGPADAVAAGLHALDPADDDQILVLAGDLIRPDLVVEALLAAAGNRVGVDVDGHRQWACSRVRARDLRNALSELDTPGAPLRSLIMGVAPRDVSLSTEAVADLDTPADAKEYADDY